MHMNILIGSIFFGLSDEANENVKKGIQPNQNDIIRYRILSFKNPTVMRALNMNTQVVETITMDKLDSFERLKEDSIICFTEASILNTTDLIIAGGSTKSNNQLPYFGARQSIENYYAMIAKSQVEGYESFNIVGMSMTLETIPEGFSYDSMFCADKVIDSRYVAYYIEDTLESFLQVVPTKYELILTNSYKEHLDRNPQYKESTDPNIDGYCNSLKEFFEYNDIMTDIRSIHNVIEIKDIIAENYEVEQLIKISDFTMKFITDKINKTIVEYALYPFTRGIDLDKIVQNKLLIIDANGNVFIMVYKEYKEIKAMMSDISLGGMSESEKIDAIIKMQQGNK